MAGSGLPYPDRFYAAAAYAGLDGSSDVLKNFSSEVALILHALYQQATVGPCNVPKPRAWNPVEVTKWKSWNDLGNMASTEAMRLFVKILDEEDPGWYSKASDSFVEPVLDVKMSNPTLKAETPIESPYPETKTITMENGSALETQDKDVISEGVGSVATYDEWVAPPISGQRPKPRYQHGAAVMLEKMYVFGGNHNGRYLSDVQVLNLKTLEWAKVEAKVAESQDETTKTTIAPCAGHSLISWKNKIISVAGHTKDPSETVTVKEFDPQTSSWSNLKTYGKAPLSRGGQSVNLVGTSLIMFGGEDAKRSLLNDLHILDLETMTWDEIDAVGVPPSPRSDHSAAVHADNHLLIFGGGSHASCFNDLHVLDLQSMEWSRPTQQGVIPAPRAGHAGVTVGENWFIVGGGDNKNGVSETLVLNMSTFVWSVVTTVQGRVPIASEGLSIILSSCYGEEVLVLFGGYNGRYSNEVHILKPSHKWDALSKVERTPDSAAASLPKSNMTANVETDSVSNQGAKSREITRDNGVTETVKNGRDKTNDSLLESLRAEKKELEAELSKEQLLTLQLKQELDDADAQKTNLTKELQSVRSQLAAEQSRCFKLEVDVAELRQKLQTMETLQREVELLQKQKAASEEAALSAKQRQSSGGVWGWIAGTPQDSKMDS